MLRSTALIALFSLALGADVPDPRWSIADGGGLRAEVDDVSGMTQVHLHFSINKPVPGVAAGDYNIMIDSQTNGVWVYEDSTIEVVEGDTVYFWILVMVNGEGWQKTDQSSTVGGGAETTPQPTTTTPKTTTPKTTTSTTPMTTTSTEPTTTKPLAPILMFELMEPQGLRMWLNESEGVEMLQIHFNVNEELTGIDPGDWNVELTEADEMGFWMHEQTDVVMNETDVVYYWYYVVVDGHAEQLTDLSWSEAGELTTPQPTGPTESTTYVPDIISVTESSEGKLYEPGQLIFEDEFEFFDRSKWEPEITMAGGGNWEFQLYTHHRNNSYTRDGVLYIKPTLTADTYGEEFIVSDHLDMWGGQPADRCTMASFFGCDRTGGGGNIINPITSARLRTSESFSFVYGRVEVRAKLPLGDWIWPAIWMLPKKSAYGQWPASGEIDIMESRGNKDLMVDGVNIGVEQVGSTLHYGGGYPMNGWPKAHVVKNKAEGWHTDFHTYAVDWTPDYIQFFIDDEEIGKMEPPEGGFWELGEWHETDMESPWRTPARNAKMAPFDEHFFLILNVAVGGTEYFPDEATNAGGKPWSNESPHASTDFWNGKGSWLPTWNLEENNGEQAAMAIDFVKIYASSVVRD